MTTTVKVYVPQNANWKAVVTYHKPASGDMIGQPYEVLPGDEKAFYSHDAQAVKVHEEKL